MNKEIGKENQNWFKKWVARQLASAAENLLAPAEGEITDTLNDPVRPENPADILGNGPEIASLPLSPDERIRATQMLESDLGKAIEAFKLEVASRETSSSSNRLNDWDILDEMEETSRALVQLGDMYAGNEVPLYEKGEPIDPFLDKMIAENANMMCRMMRTDPRYKDEEICILQSGSLLYRYARMRRVHKALSENPAAARATIFGEHVPIEGADDPSYRESMLGKMTYGSIEEVVGIEPIAA